jgi:hypothetical protein
MVWNNYCLLFMKDLLNDLASNLLTNSVTVQMMNNAAWVKNATIISSNSNIALSEFMAGWNCYGFMPYPK